MSSLREIGAVYELVDRPDVTGNTAEMLVSYDLCYLVSKTITVHYQKRTTVKV